MWRLRAVPSLETAGLAHPVAQCHIQWLGVTSSGTVSHPVPRCHIRCHGVTSGGTVSRPVARCYISQVLHPLQHCCGNLRSLRHSVAILLPFCISLLSFPTPYQACTKKEATGEWRKLQNKECVMSVEWLDQGGKEDYRQRGRCEELTVTGNVGEM